MSFNAWKRLVTAGYQGLVLAVAIVLAIGLSAYITNRVISRIEAKVNAVTTLLHRTQLDVLAVQRDISARQRETEPAITEALTLLRAIRADQQRSTAVTIEVDRLLRETQGRQGLPGPRGPRGADGVRGHDGLSPLTPTCSPIVSVLTAC